VISMKFKDYITFGDDPFSNDIWKDLKIRLDAAEELISPNCPSNLLNTKYAEWRKQLEVISKRPPIPTPELIKGIEHYKALSLSVVNNYQPDLWKEDPRNFDPKKGHGEITCAIITDGKIVINDGNHRLCALKAANKTIPPIKVYARAEQWKKPIEAQGETLHQRYFHPDCDGMPAIRKNEARFNAVSEELKKVNIQSVVEIGACLGFGSYLMTEQGLNVSAIEADTDKFRLLQCLERRVDNLTCIGGMFDKVKLHPEKNAAVVGMSVWHHLATSKDMLEELITKVSQYDCQVIELPTNKEVRWHDAFISSAGTTREGAAEYLLAQFAKLGGYHNQKIIFTDKQYVNRETWLLTR